MDNDIRKKIDIVLAAIDNANKAIDINKSQEHYEYLQSVLQREQKVLKDLKEKHPEQFI